MSYRFISCQNRWSMAIAAAIAIGSFGCQGIDEPSGPARISQDELIEFNRNKLAAEKVLMDSLAVEWSVVRSEMQDSITPSGLYVWSDASVDEASAKLQVGDTVSWTGEMRLIDSTLIVEWTVEAPFQFIWNRSDWPRGFHEFADVLSKSGKGECLIPSHLGWGLTGWPPLIPQEAVLWLNVRQNTPDQEAISLAPYSGRLQWNEMLDAFELGQWPGGSDWMDSRQLAGSSCLAWYDSSDSFDAIPSAFHIELRTVKWRGNDRAPLDLGLTQWEFNRGDEGQLLPVIQELVQRYPKQKRWECWCPVDLAFGQEGIPEAGIKPSEVVGFKWTLSEVEPPEMATLIVL